MGRVARVGPLLLGYESHRVVICFPVVMPAFVISVFYVNNRFSVPRQVYAKILSLISSSSKERETCRADNYNSFAILVSVHYTKFLRNRLRSCLVITHSLQPSIYFVEDGCLAGVLYPVFVQRLADVSEELAAGMHYAKSRKTVSHLYKYSHSLCLSSLD